MMLGSLKEMRNLTRIPGSVRAGIVELKTKSFAEEDILKKSNPVAVW